MAGARHRSLCKFRGRRNVLEDSPRSQTQLSWRLLRRLTSLWLHRKLEGSKNSCLLWGLVRTANQDAGLCYVIGAWRGTLPAEVLSVRCIPCITMHPTNTNKKIASKTTSKTFPGRHGVQQEAPSSVSTFAGYPPTPPRRLPSFATQRSWRLLRRLAFVTYTQEVQATHIFFQLHASIQGARYPARSGVAGNLSR